jgi:hypothetical protein
VVKRAASAQPAGREVECLVRLCPASQWLQRCAPRADHLGCLAPAVLVRLWEFAVHLMLTRMQ